MLKIKWVGYIIVLAIGIIAGIWLYKTFSFQEESRVQQEDSTLLLEKIKKVAKLVTVEAYFTEMYAYKDYLKYDIWPLRKKALLRVKARVSAGVDLENLELRAEDETSTIYISGIPSAEILYLETDFDYYDLSEGTFNSFSEKDHSAMQQKAKNFIRNAAIESDILQQADEQASDLMSIIRFMVESSGWLLEIESSKPLD